MDKKSKSFVRAFGAIAALIIVELVVIVAFSKVLA